MCPLIEPDFSEVQESTPVPPGTYLARILACEPRESKTTGNPYLNWRLELYGDPKINGRNLFYMTMTKGPGAFRLQQLCKAALGSTPKQFDTEDFIGKEITATVVEGADQNGNPRAEVKTVTRAQH